MVFDVQVDLFIVIEVQVDLVIVLEISNVRTYDIDSFKEPTVTS